MNSVPQAPKLKVHHQRAADLRTLLLLVTLGAGIRVGAPVEQPVVGALPVKGGG